MNAEDLTMRSGIAALSLSRLVKVTMDIQGILYRCAGLKLKWPQLLMIRNIYVIYLKYFCQNVFGCIHLILLLQVLTIKFCSWIREQLMPVGTWHLLSSNANIFERKSKEGTLVFKARLLRISQVPELFRFANSSNKLWSIFDVFFTVY